MVTRLRKELKGLKEGGLLTEQLRRPSGTVYATHGGAHPSPKGASRQDRKLSRWNRSNESIRRDRWTSDRRIREDEILQERHSATEMYVKELRNRAARLMKREASTEVSFKPCYSSALLTVFSLILQACVRVLEERLKQYDESNLSSYESIGSLKIEIARYKDAETHSTQYIADLEARLLLADESILGLQQAVERPEKEAEHRRGEVESF